MNVKSESEVSQSCPTLSNPRDCSLPGSSVHGIFQARVLEWGAIALSVQRRQYHPNCVLQDDLSCFSFGSFDCPNFFPFQSTFVPVDMMLALVIEQMQ